MAVDAGTVFTFFEGMADSLFKTIDEIEKKLENLSNKEFVISAKFDQEVIPIDKINKAIGRVEEQIDRLADVVEEIAIRADNTIQGARKQLDNLADSTIANLGNKATLNAEAFFTRATFLAVGITSLIDTGITSLVSGGERVRFAFSDITNVVDRVFTTFTAFFRVSNQNIPQLISNLARGAGILTAGTFVLSEIFLVTKRLVGAGNQALTPLQRGTRLVSFLDEAFSRTFFTVKSLVAGVGALAVAINVPVAGLLLSAPILNAFVNTFLVGVRKLRDRVSAAFGDSRASFILIIQDIRKLLATVLPGLINVGKNFRTMQSSANAAARSVKRVGEGAKNFDQLQALSRTKFPLAQQFQGFTLQASLFIEELIGKINLITQIIIKAFGITNTDLEQLGKKAGKTTSSFLRNVEQTRKEFDVMSERGVGFLSFLRRATNLGNILRTSFGAVKKVFVGIAASPVLLPLLAGQGILAAAGGIKNIFQGITGFFSKARQGVKTTIIGSPEQAKQAQQFTEKLKPIPALNQQIAKTMRQGGSEINRASTAVLELGTRAQKEFAKVDVAVQATTKKIDNFAKTVRDAVLDVLNLRKANLPLRQSDRKTQSPFGRGGANDIRIFFESIQKVRDTGEGAEKLIFRLNRVLGAFATTAKRAGTSVEGVRKINEAIEKLASGQIKIQPEKVLRVFQDLEKAIIETRAKTGVGGRDIANAFVTQLSTALREKRKDLEEPIAQMAELIASFFPQSPAKRGPLQKLPRVGPAIIGIITGGIERNTSFVKNSLSKFTNFILSFFPYNPGARLGALTLLPRVGIAIVRIIARGITRSIGLITKPLKALTSNILLQFGGFQGVIQSAFGSSKEIVKAASDIKLLSDRTGIAVERLSALDFAIQQSGGQAGELSFIFRNLQNKITDALSGANEEFRKDLDGLGISLEGVASSSEPVLTLLLKMSDAIKKFGVDSEEGKKALQAIGVVGNSTVINFLQQGSEGILEYQERAAKSGLVVSDAFAKSSLSVQKLSQTIGSLKTRLQGEFVGELLPIIEESGKKIINFVTQSRAKISALIRISGEAVARVLTGLKDLIIFIATEPGKALDITVKLLRAFFTLAVNIGDQIFDIVKNQLFIFFKQATIFSFEALRETASVLFTFLKEQFLIRGQQLLSLIVRGLVRLGQEVIGFVLNIPKIVETVIIFLGKVIAGFFGKLPRTLINTLDILGLYIRRWVLTMVITVLNIITREIQDSELLTKILGNEAAGAVTASVGLVKQLNEINKDINATTSREARAFRGIIDGAGGALNGLQDLFTKGVEDGQQKAAESTKKFTIDIVGALEKSRDKVKEMGEEGKKTADNIFNDEQASKFLGAFDKFGEEVKASSAGIQKFSDDMSKIFSSFDEKVEDSTKKTKHQIASIESTTKATAENVVKVAIASANSFLENGLGKSEGGEGVSFLNISSLPQQIQNIFQQLGNVQSPTADIDNKVKAIREKMDNIEIKAITITQELLKQAKAAGLEGKELEKVESAIEQINIQANGLLSSFQQQIDTLRLQDLIDGNSEAFATMTSLIEESKSEVQKFTEEFQKTTQQFDQLKQSIAESNLPGNIKSQFSGLADEAKNLAELKLVRQLNQGTISALSGAFDTALNTFVTKGKLAMKDIADIGKQLFQDSFKQISEFLKGSVEEALTLALQAVGANTGLAAGLVGGITAAAGLLLSRLESEVNVTNNAIQDNFQETSEAVRGVLAGDTSLGIREVTQKIVEGNVPVVIRLDTMIQLLRQIASNTGGIQPGSTQQILNSGDLGLVNSF